MGCCCEIGVSCEVCYGFGSLFLGCLVGYVCGFGDVVVVYSGGVVVFWVV